MDTQQAYERIRAWFDRPEAQLARKKVGVGGAGLDSCFYRFDPATGEHTAHAPLRCAVGCLIPDSMYVEGYSNPMECGIVSALLSDFPEVKGYLYDVDKQFLRRAQVLHDQKASDARTFVAMLDLLAVGSGLDVSDVDDASFLPIAA